MVDQADYLNHHHTLVKLGNRLGDAEGDLDRFADDGDSARGNALIRNLRDVANALNNLIQDLTGFVDDDEDGREGIPPTAPTALVPSAGETAARGSAARKAG